MLKLEQLKGLEKILNAIGLGNIIYLAPIFSKKSNYKASERQLLKNLYEDEKLAHSQKLELNDIYMNEDFESFKNKVAQFENMPFDILYENNLHELRNKVDMISKVILTAGESFSEENIDIDWLSYYFSIIKRVESKEMKEIWLQLLLEAGKHKEYASKILINALSLMSADQCEFFSLLCRYVITEYTDCDYLNGIHAYPVIFYKRNENYYNSSKIFLYKLKELEHLGLIELDFNLGFVIRRHEFKGIYQNIVFELKSTDGKFMRHGDVTFTQSGYLLYTLLNDIKYNNKLLDDIIDFMCNRNTKCSAISKSAASLLK